MSIGAAVVLPLYETFPIYHGATEAVFEKPVLVQVLVLKPEGIEANEDKLCPVIPVTFPLLKAVLFAPPGVVLK